MENEKGLDLSLALPCGGSSYSLKYKNDSSSCMRPDEGDRGSKLINEFKNFLEGGNHQLHLKTEENFYSNFGKAAVDLEISSNLNTGEKWMTNDGGPAVVEEGMRSCVGEKRKSLFSETSFQKKHESETNHLELTDKASHISINTDDGSTAENEDVVDSDVDGSTSRQMSQPDDESRCFVASGSASGSLSKVQKEIHAYNDPSGIITDSSEKEFNMTSLPIPYGVSFPTQPGNMAAMPFSGHVKDSKEQHAQGAKIASNEVKGLHKKEEETKLIIDQLLVTKSTQLQENHKSDKGGSETILRKPRRKKHRPKVMIVGQPKSTPKPSAKNSTASKKTIKVKRKFIQRESADNPINTPSEGENSRTDSSDFFSNSEGRREYKRRKIISKLETTLNSATKTRSLNSILHIRRSCRRSLNFNLESQVRVERSSSFLSSKCDAESQAEILNAKEKSRTPLPHIQGIRVFFDVMHDKEASTVNELVSPNDHWTPKSQCDSSYNSTCLTQKRQVGGLKRHYIDNNNGTGGMHFPVIYKKKRTKKECNRATPNLKHMINASDNHVKLQNQPFTNSFSKFFTRRTDWEFSISQGNNPARDKIENEQKIFQGLLILGPTEWIKKKRSKGHTRMRNLASLIEICEELPDSSRKRAQTSIIDRNIKCLNKHSACMKALAADTCPTMTTKKRSKRSWLMNTTVKKLHNHHKFFCKSMGPLAGITWQRKSPIDSVIQKLNELDLNAKSNPVSVQKQNAFLKFHISYEESNALVPYEGRGPVVPVDSLFDQVTRRQPRAKVNLDDETTRVWKLLLENINSEGIDGTDKGNRKWWEDERRVFNGRADSFIARMHLIQGDRRFSPWKGSVVDSTVGVFLTQNVSDHLSSSAFMSLAAYFPYESKADVTKLYDETVGAEFEEPEVCVLGHDDAYKPIKELLTKPACGDNAKIFQDLDCDVIRMINNVESSENKFDCIIPKVDSSNQLSENSVHDSVAINTNTTESPVQLSGKRTEIRLLSASEEEPTAASKLNRFFSSTSFLNLIQMAGTVLHGVSKKGSENKNSDAIGQMQSERLIYNLQNEHHFASDEKPNMSYCTSTKRMEEVEDADHFELFKNNILTDTTSRKRISTSEVRGLSKESSAQTTFQKFTVDSLKEKTRLYSLSDHSSSKYHTERNQIIVETLGKVPEHSLLHENKYKIQDSSNIAICPQNLMNVTGSSSRNIDHSKMSEHKDFNLNMNDHDYHPAKPINRLVEKEGKVKKEKLHPVDRDHLRDQAPTGGKVRETMTNTLDSVDWDAVRCADANEISNIIKERGMNNILAQRIKDFLNRLVRDHGSINLEWLRDIPPDKAKEYLLSIRGLGLKSVECVRLLTLHQLAFPVDTNVGRIAVRLGWVPLQPLPESVQLHLLELYPVLESIQKYLWPRLCKLDQRTLYELHYQMITFGKVFCTKNKPNCNACPMRGECRHFASAFASARLGLPYPEERSIASLTKNNAAGQKSLTSTDTLQLPSTETDQMDAKMVSNFQPIVEEPTTPEPIIEVPVTPEAGYTQVPEYDIENSFCEDSGEIPTIQLNMEEFTHNLQEIMHQNTKLMEIDMSKALVALNSEAASIPLPKLKNMSRLRTEHQVYELPDSNPLLEGMDKREPDDPCPYLLAIWTPGETPNSTEPPRRRCRFQDFKKLCSDETCLSCNSIREADSQTVRGTLLIPCRTAMRGSFPLNGTYFQVNEVFSDHESSLNPMVVPREWLWNMPRRMVYFGTSIPTIFKGLSTEAIQYCFWRGFVCVRGFDRRTRAPRPLIARLHFPPAHLLPDYTFQPANWSEVKERLMRTKQRLHQTGFNNTTAK